MGGFMFILPDRVMLEAQQADGTWEPLTIPGDLTWGVIGDRTGQQYYIRWQGTDFASEPLPTVPPPGTPVRFTTSRVQYAGRMGALAWEAEPDPLAYPAPGAVYWQPPPPLRTWRIALDAVEPIARLVETWEPVDR